MIKVVIHNFSENLLGKNCQKWLGCRFFLTFDLSAITLEKLSAKNLSFFFSFINLYRHSFNKNLRYYFKIYICTNLAGMSNLSSGGKKTIN